MSIHTTLTDIANEALIAMRKEPISNVEEAVESQTNRTSKTTAAILWMVIHDVIRDEQKRFHWQELEVIFPLVQLAEPDPGNNQNYYQYAYPADMISPIQLHSGLPWNRRGNFLYTLDASAVLHYIKSDFDNIQDWSTDLFNCCWSGLAARTAGRLTQDSRIVQEMSQKHQYYRAQSSMIAGRDRESAIQRGSDFSLVQASKCQNGGGLNPTDTYRVGNTPLGFPFPGGIS